MQQVIERAQARKKFQGYKSARPIAVMEPKVDRAVEGMMDVWKKAQARWHLDVQQRIYDHYSSMVPLVEGFGHSAEQVERFVSFLAEIKKQDRDFSQLGLETFLSLLVNTSRDSDFVLDLRFLPHIMGIGQRNSKNVTVLGNVEHGFGNSMESGLLSVKGNCFDGVGTRMTGGKIIVEGYSRWTVRGTADRMKGGTVVIKKSCENEIGHCMEGGRIIIHGDLAPGYEVHLISREHAEKSLDIGYNMKGGEIYILGKAHAVIGDEMEGGEIHLYDDFNEIGDVHKGKIFHKGKLIVDR